MFTMNGGTISGNSASGSYSYGGGVYMDSSLGGSGTFTKQSGGIIYGSDASDNLKNAAELDKTKREIAALIDLSGGVTFESIARCKRARERAGDADGYALVLALLDGPNRQDEVSRLVSHIDTAINEAKAIPVDVRVTGDVNGRLKAAFAGVFTAEGFKTGSRNSRYALEVALTITPAPKTAYFNARYTVDAVLKDTQTGTELFTYNAANRESHPAGQEEANNRVITGALRKITEEFPAVLRDYLDSAG
jgi:hypothetical protein